MRDLKDQFTVVVRVQEIYNPSYYSYEGGSLKNLPLPKKSIIVGLFKGSLIVSLKAGGAVGDQTFSPGSVLAVDKGIAGQEKIFESQVQLLYTPDDRTGVNEITFTKDRVLINVLRSVRGEIFQVEFSEGRFSPAQLMNLIPGAHLCGVTASFDSSDFFVLKEDFLEPKALYFYDGERGQTSKIQSLTSHFNNENIVALQKWAKSFDGTSVPYFLVGKESQMKKGEAPTLLYGYGGFEISCTPSYNRFLGQSWLEKGGLYALANIRGGGEFGPEWHECALKTNRHKSYNDFIAVAEDLIKSKVTVKDKLAIHGGSNGGLLVGAVMIQRPDLFRAVVCEVPLLDMIRYSQLLAGFSWVGEYGDPGDEKMKEYLLSYSPYQNIKKEEKYPDLLLTTSTKDDRVHPGHARKMAAKMFHLGHKNVYYYENIEGGHALAANLKQTAKRKALIFEFLFRTIGKDLKGVDHLAAKEVLLRDSPHLTEA